MNLDKYIKIQMIVLSSKYNISIVEITRVKEGRVKRTYNVSYELLKDKTKSNKETFYSKRDMVSWLLNLR